MSDTIQARKAAYLRSLLMTAAVVMIAQTGTAFAADAVADSTTVEEVTVTARFREETLSSVPVAVSVISGDEVAAKNLNNLQDIAQTIPPSTSGLARPTRTAPFLSAALAPSRPHPALSPLFLP